MPGSPQRCGECNKDRQAEPSSIEEAIDQCAAEISGIQYHDPATGLALCDFISPTVTEIRLQDEHIHMSGRILAGPAFHADNDVQVARSLSAVVARECGSSGCHEKRSH